MKVDKLSHLFTAIQVIYIDWSFDNQRDQPLDNCTGVGL